jgi:hypothetical protein
MRQAMRRAVVLAAMVLAQGCKKEPERQLPPPSPAPRAQKPTPAATPAPAPAPESASGKPVEKKAPAGCNSDFSQAIQANQTLTEQCSPYTLSQTLSVDGWDLTIEPGVEIRIGADRRIDVGSNKGGRLIARGTPEKPIRFVSNGRKEPGAWRKIALHEKADGSTLEHVIIEHAGHENEGAVESRAQDIHLKNVRFVGIQGRVLQEDGEARLAEFADNDMSQAGGSEVLAVLRFESVAALQGANQWPEKAVVQLEGGVRKDTQVPNAGVPYRVVRTVTIVAGDESGTASLKVAPGVVFQMAEGVRWDIGYAQHGQVEAVGTADQPIVWTRFGEAKAGTWKGLLFFDKARPPVLEHVRIEYAGEKDGAALSYQRSKGLGKLTHVTVRQSAGHALMAEGPKTEGFEAFSDNTFEGIGQSTLRVEAHMASKLGAGNTYPQEGSIELDGRIDNDTVLTAQGVPYRVARDIVVEGEDDLKPTTLTVEPGVVMQFGPAGRLSIGYTHPGLLVGVGAADKPITFTASAEGGGWKGLNFYPKGKLQLEHAILEGTADNEQAIEMSRRSQGGVVKDVVFKGLKTPILNCVGRKLSVKNAKADPGVKLESRKGC